MKTRKSSMRDVAARAGVSIATVSRVIAGTGTFSPDTVTRVREAVAALGYRRVAGTLARGRADRLTVAFSVSDIDLLNPFFWELAKGIYDTSAVHACGIALRVFQARVDSGEGIEDELRRSGTAGVIYVPHEASTREAVIDAAAGFPLVLLDRTIAGAEADCVVAENGPGARQAAQYLLQLGHRRILYVGGPAALSTERERRAGFLQGLAEAGPGLAPVDVLEAGFELHLARAAVRDRLEGARDFTAVFASNDLMAFGAKEALDAAGLRVPEDVSLVGFDNIPFSGTLGLTTMSQNSYDMGRSALQLLLDRIHGRAGTPRRMTYEPSLMIRRSCRRIDP
jgi:LacI family transcriptional regulator